MNLSDEALLIAMEISGVVANSTDQKRRLDGLLNEGLCYCERRNPPIPGYAAPILEYHLSIAGKTWLQASQAGRLKGE